MTAKEYNLAELAQLTNSKLVGDPNYCIIDVSDLDNATPQDASFLSNHFLTNARYEKAMATSKAGVIFVAPAVKLTENRNFLVNDNPSEAFQKLIELFHSDSKELSGFIGIHPTAVVHATCNVGHGVTIGPMAVVDKNAIIGDGTFVGAGAYVGPNTTIGKNCIIHPNVTVRERCTIGDRVILQPGAVIGSCGFGYLTSAQGKHSKLNQVGNVILEDDVEIGANTTIDRARFKSTRIRKGTKLDNLIQIAHGVELGEDNIFAAQTGVAGSATTGRCVMAGGQVAILGHIHIGDMVMIAAKSGVSKSLASKGKYNGIPAVPVQEYNRNAVYVRNMEKYVKKIKELEERLAQLELKTGGKVI